MQKDCEKSKRKWKLDGELTTRVLLMICIGIVVIISFLCLAGNYLSPRHAAAAMTQRYGVKFLPIYTNVKQEDDGSYNLSVQYPDTPDINANLQVFKDEDGKFHYGQDDFTQAVLAHYVKTAAYDKDLSGFNKGIFTVKNYADIQKVMDIVKVTRKSLTEENLITQLQLNCELYMDIKTQDKVYWEPIITLFDDTPERLQEVQERYLLLATSNGMNDSTIPSSTLEAFKKKYETTVTAQYRGKKVDVPMTHMRPELTYYQFIQILKALEVDVKGDVYDFSFTLNNTEYEMGYNVKTDDFFTLKVDGEFQEYVQDYSKIQYNYFPSVNEEVLKNVFKIKLDYPKVTHYL
ncbi:MAG: hypothetical protein RSC43_00195 [Clostridia bacterium]